MEIGGVGIIIDKVTKKAKLGHVEAEIINIANENPHHESSEHINVVVHYSDGYTCMHQLPLQSDCVALAQHIMVQLNARYDGGIKIGAIPETLAVGTIFYFDGD